MILGSLCALVAAEPIPGKFSYCSDVVPRSFFILVWCFEDFVEIESEERINRGRKQ